jgi:hypothetical protein
MDELHRRGGMPPGWQFTLPPEGDPVAGREVFVALRCYTCHTIAGEQFPPVKPSERMPAPDLTGMGSFHPAAYFAESILYPSAVVTDGPGYADADGFSNMPSYIDALTMRQWLDLVAYLHSLRAPVSHEHHGSHSHTQPAVSAPQPHKTGEHMSHSPPKK